MCLEEVRFLETMYYSALGLHVPILDQLQKKLSSKKFGLKGFWGKLSPAFLAKWAWSHSHAISEIMIVFLTSTIKKW